MSITFFYLTGYIFREIYLIMRFLAGLFVVIFGTSLLVLLFSSSRFNGSTGVVSPLGKSLNRVSVRSAQTWFPDEGASVSGKTITPDLLAESALSFDLSSEKFLYRKDIRDKRPIASLAKIMTAIIALKRSRLEDIFYVSEEAASTGEDSMGLSGGETYTLEELLYGLFLVSGNDAAEVIAENVGGDRETFVRWMNEEATEIGLYDTHFVNPSGLPQEERESVSTAYDLLLLTRYSLYKFPVLSKIASTRYYEIPYSEDHKYLSLENVTNLLGSYPGVSGFKTGYTEEAGLCLVTIAENGGHEIVAIILKSFDRRADATLLLDYSFELLGISNN